MEQSEHKKAFQNPPSCFQGIPAQISFRHVGAGFEARNWVIVGLSFNRINCELRHRCLFFAFFGESHSAISATPRITSELLLLAPKEKQLPAHPRVAEVAKQEKKREM